MRNAIQSSKLGTNSYRLHIVIVGAGLSGLAAAIGLRRSGHTVTVLEQTAELREVGAGIQLPANSSRILDQLGILEKVKKFAVQPRDLVIRSYKGEELYRQNLCPAIQERFQYPHLLIHRADLRRLLFDQARDHGASIRLGAPVRTINFSASQVELVTGECYAADLIIGADGEHSICRESLLGHGDPPLSSGDVVYRLAIPASRVVPHLPALMDPPCVHAWYGPNSHAVCYQLLKNGIFNVVLTLPESEGAATIGPRPADLDAIRNQCKNWDPKFQQLLNMAENSLKWTLLQTKELESWTHHSGRFVLLGDSAHATLPYLYLSPPQITNTESPTETSHRAQGAALALESAHTLSTLLQNISEPTQLPSLLDLYTQLRIPRARRTRQRSKDMHDICQLVDGPAQRDRDRVFRDEEPAEGFPNPWADPGFQDWMWAYDAEAVAQRAWEESNLERRESKGPRSPKL